MPISVVRNRQEPPMSANKLRLGIVMAALSVVVGGPALGAASTAAAWAESGWTGPDAVADNTAPAQAPVVESATLANYDWQ
jgi:hypothetical protein